MLSGLGNNCPEALGPEGQYSKINCISYKNHERDEFDKLVVSELNIDDEYELQPRNEDPIVEQQNAKNTQGDLAPKSGQQKTRASADHATRYSSPVLPLLVLPGLTALLVLPVLIWQSRVILRQHSARRIETQEAYADGEIAHANGVARIDWPEKHSMHWLQGWDAARQEAAEIKEKAIEDSTRKKLAAAEALADRERIALEESKQRELLQNQRTAWIEARTALSETYHTSGKFREYASDSVFIQKQIRDAGTPEERALQRKLLNGLTHKIRRDEYQQVRGVLEKHGITTYQHWIDLNGVALENDWQFYYD